MYYRIYNKKWNVLFPNEYRNESEARKQIARMENITERKGNLILVQFIDEKQQTDVPVLADLREVR